MKPSMNLDSPPGPSSAAHAAALPAAERACEDRFGRSDGPSQRNSGRRRRSLDAHCHHHCRRRALFRKLSKFSMVVGVAVLLASWWCRVADDGFRAAQPSRGAPPLHLHDGRTHLLYCVRARASRARVQVPSRAKFEVYGSSRAAGGFVWVGCSNVQIGLAIYGSHREQGGVGHDQQSHGLCGLRGDQ